MSKFENVLNKVINEDRQVKFKIRQPSKAQIDRIVEYIIENGDRDGEIFGVAIGVMEENCNKLVSKLTTAEKHILELTARKCLTVIIDKMQKAGKTFRIEETAKLKDEDYE